MSGQARRRPGDYHGTIGGYNNHRCRCEGCRAAWNTYHLRLRDQLAGRPVPKHGTETGYTDYGCRCAACTAVHTAGNRRRLRARTEAGGG